ALSMPAQQRLRLDNRQYLEDRWKPSIELYEEEPIDIRELDATALLSLQDCQLMLERSILGFKPVLRPGWQHQQSQEKHQQRDHCRVRLRDSVAESIRTRLLVHTGVGLPRRTVIQDPKRSDRTS